MNDSHLDTTCTYHPSKLTLLSCTRCGKPACHDCLVPAAVGAQCVACVRGAAPTLQETISREAALVKRSVRPSPAFGLLLAMWIGSGVALVSVPVARMGEFQKGDRFFLFAFVILGWLVSLCLHEFAHAIVAFVGGDRTVRSKGYLTLDIRKYADKRLSIIFPMIFLLIGGIGLPGGAVWINTGLIRTNRLRSLMSLAGPFTNLALAVLLVLPNHFNSPRLALLVVACNYLALLELGAFVLNMLPVPGFDGFGALEPYLPSSFLRSIAPYRAYLPMLMLFLLLGGSGFATQLWTAIDGGFKAIGGDRSASILGSYLFRFWETLR